MIFVTGDTHRLKDVDKLDREHFPEQDMLSSDDFLIITGDFGGIWSGDSRDEECIEFHRKKLYTTLFVGGNHENYDLLSKYPVEEWNGGKIHKINRKLIHLINGQIYTIEGKKFFIMGGATSIDKMFRKSGISWWPQEEPSNEEFFEATQNLVKNENTVDYIITHTCPEKLRREVFDMYNDVIEYSSAVEKYLDIVKDNVNYKKWYAGHLHIDRDFPDYNIRILYHGLVKI